MRVRPGMMILFMKRGLDAMIFDWNVELKKLGQPWPAAGLAPVHNGYRECYHSRKITVNDRCWVDTSQSRRAKAVFDVLDGRINWLLGLDVAADE